MAGWIIGRLKMEACLEDRVRDMPKMSAAFEATGMTLGDRIQGGFQAVKEIAGKVSWWSPAAFFWWGLCSARLGGGGQLQTCCRRRVCLHWRH